MALKVGTENKRNVIIAGVLFCVVAYLVVKQFMGDEPKPAPMTAPTVVKVAPQARPAQAAGRMSIQTTAGPAARQLPGTGLDPALHLDRLALSESIEYAGTGRNIFSMDSTPVVMEQPVASARPQNAAPVVEGPPPPPKPPAIDLRYFGYSSGLDGKRKAFFVHGEDIFQASAGDIVNHRYKVVAVDVRSVQVTDLSYNNTQTLPLAGN